MVRRTDRYAEARRAAMELRMAHVANAMDAAHDVADDASWEAMMMAHGSALQARLYPAPELGKETDE